MKENGLYIYIFKNNVVQIIASPIQEHNVIIIT